MNMSICKEICANCFWAVHVGTWKGREKCFPCVWTFHSVTLKEGELGAGAEIRVQDKGGDPAA